MGLRSSSLAKRNDDTLTWVLHKRDAPRKEHDRKPRETENINYIMRPSYATGSNASPEYRARRYNNHVQKKKRNHVHTDVLDYGKSEQTYGYGITDLDDFLAKASIGRPGNIPVVLCTGCLLYQTQLDDHYQTEVALPLGTVVNAVFKNEQWLYVQTPHAQEGYVPYDSCLPLGIAPPPPDEARAPCWETQSDVFPRPVGDRRRRRRRRGHLTGSDNSIDNSTGDSTGDSTGSSGRHGRRGRRRRHRHRDRSSVVDGGDRDGDDVVATLLYRRGRRGSDASPPRPSSTAVGADDRGGRQRLQLGDVRRTRDGVVTPRSITGYGYL